MFNVTWPGASSPSCKQTRRYADNRGEEHHKIAHERNLESKICGVMVTRGVNEFVAAQDVYPWPCLDVLFGANRARFFQQRTRVTCWLLPELRGRRAKNPLRWHPFSRLAKCSRAAAFFPCFISISASAKRASNWQRPQLSRVASASAFPPSFATLLLPDHWPRERVRRL